MFTRPTQLLLMFLVFIGFATGCAVSGLPSEEKYAAIQAGKRAVVFLRVTAELRDGTQVGAFESFYHEDNIGLGLGGFDTGGEISGVYPLFLSTKARKQGWVYFILEPGIYYLAFQGVRSTDLLTHYRKLKSTQRWRIDIPVGSRLVYVGTLHLKCRSRWYLTGGKKCDFIDAMVVKNQELLASKVAEEYLEDLALPQTLLMQPHSGTIILRKPK